MSFEEIRREDRQQWRELQNSRQPVIFIGTATCGRSAGALDVLEVFQKEMPQRGVDAHIVEVGCIGLCSAEPLVCITKPGQPGICYGNVTPKAVPKILRRHLRPIGLVRNGDPITIDAESSVLGVDIDEAEMEKRRAAWSMPPYKATRGTLHKYIKTVKNASEGCVTDE